MAIETMDREFRYDNLRLPDPNRRLSIDEAVHEAKPSPDGGAPYLDAGQPLTIDFLKHLAKALCRTTQCEILPPNVLVYTPEMLVWWTRQQHREMFYGGSSDGRTLSGIVFPQPPLVFKVCGSELSVQWQVSSPEEIVEVAKLSNQPGGVLPAPPMNLNAVRQLLQ
jgi:hypothetical protein